MAFLLEVISLEAKKAGADPELWGEDETYIKINSKKVWQDSFSTGETLQVDHQPQLFRDNAKIDLYDKDFGFWNSDDHMGSITIRPNTSEPYNQPVVNQVTLTGGGSEYLVTYQTTHLPPSPWG
jgi:hypothetical protein